MFKVHGKLERRQVALFCRISPNISPATPQAKCKSMGGNSPSQVLPLLTAALEAERSFRPYGRFVPIFSKAEIRYFLLRGLGMLKLVFFLCVRFLFPIQWLYHVGSPVEAVPQLENGGKRNYHKASWRSIYSYLRRQLWKDFIFVRKLMDMISSG